LLLRAGVVAAALLLNMGSVQPAAAAEPAAAEPDAAAKAGGTGGALYSDWKAKGGVVPAQAATDPTAKYVGEKVCVECHDVEKKGFGHTQHSEVFHQNPRNEVEKSVCEACHGPGSKHVADTKDKNALIGFSKEWGTPIAKQTAQCLTCHSGGQRMHWQGSIHQVNKLSCSDCHNPMARFSANGLMKKSSITETCQSCHPQQRAEFRKKSHMPVPEGKMTCEDCHNPHGTTSPRLLKADSVNELCYTCHAEKRGPFIWEHAPVRENCLNCHLPHGSNQTKLLMQAQPLICAGCHSTTGTMGHAVWGNNTLGGLVNGNPTTQGLNNAGQPVNSGATIIPSKRMVGRGCVNCHSQIHGSNSPAGARFQR
jgi:DmsE family decaheme c-type cytochrome